MSSAILYIGIVAIWAFVLVPRWLRRDHGQADGAAEADAGSEAEPVADPRTDLKPADGDEPSPQATGRPTEVPNPARARVMQSRRRLLTTLLTLTGGAFACHLLKLAPLWSVVPPAGMLGMYVLLLRQATIADREQERRRAAQATQAAHAQPARRPAEAPRRARVITFEPPEPSADVIDISARVGDQLYDQYADATIRAVGD